MRIDQRLSCVGISMLVLCLGILHSVNALGEIPYPDALDEATVRESKISDLKSEGLVIGNGDINGLLYERSGTLCLRVSKNDIWDARVDTSEDPPMMKVDVSKNSWTGGGGLNKSYGNPFPTPRTAAIVLIRTNAGPSVLDLRRAVATSGDLRVRALAGQNVFLVETAAEVSIEEIKAGYLPAAELGENGGVKWLHMKMPGDGDYHGMEYAVAVAGHGKHKAVALVTSWDTKENVRDAAVQLARKTADEDAALLVARHEEEWARFWSASGVALADPDFQTWWYRMVYLLRCISKPGSVPTGLFVSSTTDAPPWHGDYHHNYNAWQPFWTAFNINHPELAEPWADYMNAMLPRLKWRARTIYDCEGANVGIASFPFEPDPANCQLKNHRQYAHLPWDATLGMMGMSAQVLWFSHLYRPDRKYLEEKVYPVVREAALFYCSFAEKCPRDEKGKAKFGPSFSPEHGKFGVANVPFDIAYAKCMMKAAITSANELGRDSDLVARFRKALDLLPDYPTSPDENGKPVVVDWTGCKFREIKEHNITVPAVPVFPAEQVSCFSTEPEKELFLNTIRQTRHRGCNSTVMFSVAKARFSMLEALEDLRKYYKPVVQPNGMFRWPSHGYYLSESVGIAAAISEFLLQSVDRTIRVFPCWPKEKDASFSNLRAQGGFLVTAAQKAGKVTKLEITSTVGGKLRLIHPETGKLVEYETKPGDIVSGLATDIPAEKKLQVTAIEIGNAELAVVLGGNPSPAEKRAAELFAERAKDRSGLTLAESADKAKVRLVIGREENPALGVDGYSIAVDAQKREISVAGQSDSGVVAGVGRLMREISYLNGKIEVPALQISESPKMPNRGMYLWARKYYFNQPDQVDRYIEEFALWGGNALAFWFEMGMFESFQDTKGEKSELNSGYASQYKLDKSIAKDWITMYRRFYTTARRVGMKTGLLMVANDAYMSSPKELRISPIIGCPDWYLCPSKPGAVEKMVAWQEEVFKALGPLDIYNIFPADPGGCACEQCKPWPTRGYWKVARPLAERIHGISPKTEIWIDTWHLNHPTFGGKDWKNLVDSLDWSKERPEWFSGFEVALAPNHGYARMSAEERDYYNKAKQPLMVFPDISMWGNHKGMLVNKEYWKTLQAELSSYNPEMMKGGWPYAERWNTDIASVMFLSWFSNPKKSVDAVLDEYAAFYFGPEAANVRQFLELLDDSNKDAQRKQKIRETQVKLEETLPAWAKRDWRWAEIVESCRFKTR